MGREDAWDHFVREFRPGMYRAADAIDPGGGAREIADALYAELFGLKSKTASGNRCSAISTAAAACHLAASLIAQRYVDRHRETRRLEPLPDENRPRRDSRASTRPIDPDRARFVAAMRAVLARAIAALAPRDRLRLACYYAQEMTLAQIGKLTREHEATVSRQLARTRRDSRRGRAAAARRSRFSAARSTNASHRSSTTPATSTRATGSRLGRKKSAADRSMNEDPS